MRIVLTFIRTPMIKDIVYSDGLSPDYLQSVHQFIDEWFSESDHIIVQTSGSTGLPKSIPLLKSDVTKSAQTTGRFFGFDAESNLLLALSPNYIAGKLMIVRAIEFGCRLIVGSNSSNPLIEMNERIDFAAFVPYQVQEILNHPESKDRFNAINNVIVGGAPLNSELRTEIQKCKNHVYATFGMTETITHFALQNISADEEFYTCLPGYKVEIDSEGRLIVKEHPFSGHPIHTNDVVELLSEEKFRWLGRADNVINSGGVKLFPEQIEKKLADVIDAEFYIASEPDVDFGHRIVLVVEGDSVINEENISAGLDKYERPKRIIRRKQFQRTPTGKVIREKF